MFCEPHLFESGFAMALHKTTALYRVKELFSNPIQDVIHGAYGDMAEDFKVCMVININLTENLVYLNASSSVTST